jgi:hypothetical protein
MSVTKYIAPIAMIAIGVMSGGVGFAAMAAGEMGAISAGAMVAGGAISLVGTATNSKDLIQAGQIIGIAGGIGTAVYGPANGSMMAGGTTDKQLIANGATPGAQTDAGELAVSKENPTGVLPPSNASPVVNPALNPATSAPAKAAADSSTQQLLKYNMMTQAIGGVGNAIGARTTADIQATTSANQLGFQQSLANRANTVGSNTSMAPAPIGSTGGGTGLLAMNPVAVPTLQRP